MLKNVKPFIDTIFVVKPFKKHYSCLSSKKKHKKLFESLVCLNNYAQSALLVMARVLWFAWQLDQFQLLFVKNWLIIL